MFDWHYKIMVFFCLFYHLYTIFKEDIMVDHCSVFMMVTEGDDLGGDEPSILDGARSTNLG
jgi:hypothetical protein